MLLHTAEQSSISTMHLTCNWCTMIRQMSRNSWNRKCRHSRQNQALASPNCRLSNHQLLKLLLLASDLQLLKAGPVPKWQPFMISAAGLLWSESLSHLQTNSIKALGEDLELRVTLNNASDYRTLTLVR